MLLRKIDKINTDQHKVILCHLWDSFTHGIKVAMFVRFRDTNTGRRFYLLDRTNPVLFVDDDKILNNPNLVYLQGKASKEFLNLHGYRIEQRTKTIKRL